ncbi:anaphase-promoting complex subunit 5 [Dioscorea cayenensis subsp. rotundata]|uniref:Anaphase-promoting complex subunit 5 n=1 Tax=Dioscorea cayennensis subsp. rotundata TaxID=55577 RepID=A0AB40CNX3_DIOCR|nr:anaphase-promoting complex subunit 5 [Dioscorea cayenensis subsp. rotundata]
MSRSMAPAGGASTGGGGNTAARGGGSSAHGVFDITPHKIAVCQLIQVFAPPAQHSVPFPFQSVPHHNRLGLFLFSLTRSCDDFLEPPLEELLNQLKTVGGSVDDWLSDQLISSMAALSSPDDLFNFFDKLRGVLAPPEGANVEDDQIFLDPNSHLGVYLRCCMLAFNLLSFEGVCHLLTNIAVYCNLNDSTYELPEEDDYNDEQEFHDLLGDADMDLDTTTALYQKYRHESGVEAHVGESSVLHLSPQRPMYGFLEDIQASANPKLKTSFVGAETSEFVSLRENAMRNDDHQGFLRSKCQIEGYLNMQADFLERDAGLFPLNYFNAILKQLRKLAPELHRVKYLQYLNGVHHKDYLTAMDNLHCYFDYSAGMEGLFSRSSSSQLDINVGRYETALLCLGTMHCHLGHSKKALEALTEAVRISQQNTDDSCLAYTLAAICNLLSEIGLSNTTGIIGSPYSLGSSTGFGTPMSIQQQLLVLLKRSLKRADSLRLLGLVAFNRLALAKFDIKHVKRPLLSFGPKTSTKLRTCPVNVCKELRLSSHVLSQFGSEGVQQPFDDVAFSTSWLKNLAAVTAPWLKSSRKSNITYTNDYDVFHYNAQPNPIPGSFLQLAGASYLLRATSWELYGSSPLVRINALVYATCFADAASSAEMSLAFVKLIQHLAVYKGYKEALGALKLAEEKFSCLSNSRLQMLKLHLLHERALHRGQLKVAQQLCDEFEMLASPVIGVDMELKIEARLRHAHTLLAADQFSQAAAVAHTLFCECYKFKMQVENATVLLLLAEIHKKSGNAVLGLPYALASLSFCQSFNLDLLESSATLTIAELWLSLGSIHAKRALSLVCRTLPMILGHGGLELRARAHIAFAKCHLSDPTFSISEDPSVVLDPLSQAAEELEILEYHKLSAEAFYLMAIVYDKLGQLENREDAAAAFMKHLIALENPEDGDDLNR